MAFWEDAEATIPNTVERYRTSLEHDLKRSKYRSAYPLDEGLEDFVEDKESLTQSECGLVKRLTEEYRLKTIGRMNSFPRGVAIKICLQNAVFELVYEEGAAEWIGPESGCYRCHGDYIKAVVEEYARKPFFEREEIIYKEELDELERYGLLPPKERRILRVIMPPGSNGKKHKLDLKLYGVMADASSNYHYIVGYTRNLNHPELGFRPGCFRLGRAESIKPLASSAGSGRITEKERRALEERIKERGIEYLLSERSMQKIRLSARGMSNYNKIVDMRPPYITRTEFADGSAELTFCCTEFQFMNYFIRFGSDALILEPFELAQKMRDIYHEAFLAYDEGC